MAENRGVILRIIIVCIIACPGITTAASDAALLLDAVQGDDRVAVVKLLAQGAEVNAQQPDGASALAWAVFRCNAGIVRQLLDAGANPDLTNELGIGPLWLAIQAHSADMVELLLDNGADPNIARESGETPLMAAARSGQIDVMELLIRRSADVNAREKKFGQTALMWAAGNPAAVKLLLEHKADVEVNTKAWDVNYTIYAPRTRTLGKTGIPWNTSGEFVSKQGGHNALFFAIQERNMKSVRLLVDAGLDVNSVAADGTTPLLASLYKWVPLGRSDRGRSRNSQKFGADPAMARFLLDCGARATGGDGAGYTPLHGAALAVASAERNRRFAALLARYRSENEAVAFTPDETTPDEALEVARRLLEAGADPNRQTRYPTPGPVGDVRINPAPPGSSALHIAANSNSLALVRMLADRGADANLVRTDGHTPFSAAVVAGDVSIVEELIARGADLSARYNPDDKFPDPVESITLPRQNQTIMHIAAASLSPDLVDFLYAQGASINLKNSFNETPLDLADRQERVKEAFDRQRADGDPKRLRAVVRSTQTTDAIKRLLGH
jgi:ankyrin repeat protein